TSKAGCTKLLSFRGADVAHEPGSRPRADGLVQGAERLGAFSLRQFSASGPPVRTHSRESPSGRRTAMFRTRRYSLRASRSKVFCSAMNGAQLIALAHAAIEKAHHLILLAGLLGLSSILAGVISRRIGAPILL